MASKKTIVLSIDGGGIRGIVPLVILEAIERYFIPTVSLGDYFDFGAGTSTGSIIIAWLFSKGETGNFNIRPICLKSIEIMRLPFLRTKHFGVP